MYKGLEGIKRSHDCLTLVQGSEITRQKKDIEELFRRQKERAKKEYVPTGHFETQHQYELLKSDFVANIQKAESNRGYICQCKCGHIFYWPEGAGVPRIKRFCDTGADEEYCGLRKKMVDSYPREKDPSYDHVFSTNSVHDTLSNFECIDENYEGAPIVDDKRKKGAGRVIVYKKYRCQCYLCGKKHEFLSSDFEIKSDSYGPNADKGYYSTACCTDCHKTSSFQWRTIKIFQEHGINYIAEKWFQDLSDYNNDKFLRYDFAIIDSNEEIKFLIECQGEQHYKPVDDFGGPPAFEKQKRNDQKKREYAKQKNIPLIEIPYTYDTYEKEKTFLEEHGIIIHLGT